MMINDICSQIAMNLTSSISVGNNSFMLSTVKGDGFFIGIIEFLLRFVYFICKWIMYAIDIVFFYIRQLSGIEVDTSSLQTLMSADSDLFFNMVASNSSIISQIIRQLVGFVIVVLIIITIISLIKAQYQTLHTSQPANHKDIIKKSLVAFIMLFVTPMIVFGGVAMSNIVLKSLANALNLTGTTSLSSSVFSISSTSGNQFRRYAQSGKRIPIYFEFSEHNKIIDQFEKEELTQKSIDYLVSSENPGYQTHLMFYDETYYLYDDVDMLNAGTEYYEIYDQKAGNFQKSDLDRRIRNYQEEYFVMADFVDYAVKTSGVFYFKTIEEVMDIANSVANETGQIQIYDSLKSRFGIEINSSTIKFRNDYYSYDDEIMDIGAPREIEYNHVLGTIDELDGAIFVVTVETNIVAIDPTTGESKIYTYYEPLINGTKIRSDVFAFESPYLRDGSMVIAKGLFSQDGLPTAIKRAQNSTDVQFYRDELIEYDIGDITKMASFYTDSKDGGFFQGIIKFFQVIFNPESLVPKLDFEKEAVKLAYKKEATQVAAFENGRMHISYLFNKSDSFVATRYSVQIFNFFDIVSFNWIALIISIVFLIKIIWKVVFGLVQRVYDIFLLYVFYPLAFSTAPLNDGAGYKKWYTTFVSKLFSAYALILGINFVLMIGPLAENIQFFTPEEIAGNKTIRRVGSFLFARMSSNQIASMLNLVMAVIFQLVAFSLLDNKSGIVSMVNGMFPGSEDLTNNNAFEKIKGTISKMTQVASKVGSVVFGTVKFAGDLAIATVSQEKKAELAKKAATKLLKLAPGGAAIREVVDKAYIVKKKVEEIKAFANLQSAYNSAGEDGGSNKEEIKKQLEQYLKSRQDYNNSLTDTTKQRKAENDKKKKSNESDPQKESKSSRVGDEDGDKEQNELADEMQGMSSEELENTIQDNDKYVSENQEKFDSGELDDEEKQKFEQAKERSEKAKAERERRSARSNDMEQTRNRIEELEKEQSARKLTADEEAELEQSKTKMQEYENQIAQEQKAYDDRHDKKKQKERKKENELREKDKDLFRHFGGRTIFGVKYKTKQKNRIRQINSQIADASARMAEAGVGDLSDKSISELDEKLKDKNLTPEARTAIEEYRDLVEYKEQLLSLNDKALETAANQRNQTKINDNSRVQNAGILNMKKPGARLFSKAGQAIVGIGKNVNEAQIDQQISELDSEIERLSNSLNEKDIEKRRKLVEKRNKLKSRKTVSQAWDMGKTEESKETHRQKEERRKKFEKADKEFNLSEKAIQYLTKKNLPITQENIDKYLDALNQYRIDNGEDPYF